MQENLLFFGLAEPPRGMKENTEAKLREFLVTEMVETASRVQDIVFDRVHRIRRPEYDFFTGQAKSRPVVAKFEKYTDREYIRKAGVELNKRQRRFSVREQFPPEIEERQKTLYPIMRNLNKDGDNRVTLVRDKLYVNGKLYNNDFNTINVKQTQPGQAWNRQSDRRYVRPKATRPRPPPPPPTSGGGLMTSNPFQPLINFSDTPIITSGKKKASSPLPDEQETMKRLCSELVEAHAQVKKADESNDILLAGEILAKETETLHMDTQQSNVNDVNDDVISLEDGTETTENEQSGHDTLNLGTGVNDKT